MGLHNYGKLVAFVILSLIGATLLPRLPIQLMPSLTGHSITVSYAWPGASPQAIEQQVTARLEGVFSMLTGIKKIRSVSSYNRGHITIELDQAINTDEIRFEVAAVLRQVYSQLPSELSYPRITLNSPEDQNHSGPLMTLQLSGPVSSGKLQSYADEQLKPQLAAIHNVSNVSIFGGSHPEWLLTYSAEVLNRLNFTEMDLRRAVQQHFLREPLGQIQQTGGSNLRVILDNVSRKPTLPSKKTYNWDHIPVKNQNGRLIYLNNLVSVTYQEPAASQFYRINGKTGVKLVLSAMTGANQLLVADELIKKISAIKLPSAYSLNIEYDSTTYIRQNLQKTIIQTFIATSVLLLFVLITTQNKNYVLLIATSTLVTLLISVIIFTVLHLEIHLYSLAAITTSLGMVIDNVIIMIDHYRRYRDYRVFTALLGSTLTTCSGLIIVWLLPEENRHVFVDFALVMLVTLFVSLLVSVIFVPAVMEHFWERDESEAKRKKKRLIKAKSLLKIELLYAQFVAGIIRFRGSMLVIIILLFGLPVFWLPLKVDSTIPLASIYNSTLGSDRYITHMKSFANKWLGGTLRLFVNYVFEGSRHSEPERTALHIIAELPNQSTPEQMDALLLQFEREFVQYGEIDKLITQVNNGQEGSMIIYFREPHDKGAFPYQLKNRAILISSEMSGVDWSIYGVGQAFSQKQSDEESPIFNVVLFGYNYRDLEEQALKLGQMLERHPRIQNVNTNRSPSLFQHKSLYEFSLQTNPQSLTRSGISATSLYDKLSDYNAQAQPDLHALIQDTYSTIKIIPSQSQKVDIWTLQQEPLQVGASNIKLAETTKIVRQKVLPAIYKEDQQYRRVVSFEYLGSYGFGKKFLTETLNKIRPKLPLGYSIKVIDQSWFDHDSLPPYELIALVVLLIYIICAVIFESLWQPLALIGLIPVSYIGVFLIFYWTNSNFDQGGYASFILLAGNVVCAGIFIIAEMNRIQCYIPGLSAIKIYQKAFRRKIGPVLLIVLSTIIGLLPFLLYEKEPFWNAFGIGTIGGLTMSLIAVFIYLPLFLIKKRKVN